MYILKADSLKPCGDMEEEDEEEEVLQVTWTSGLQADCSGQLTNNATVASCHCPWDVLTPLMM